MTDLFSQFDSSFVLLGYSLIINILTQIGKPLHKSPLQVFYFVAFVACLVLGVTEYLYGHESVMGVVGEGLQVVVASAGFWHLFMRENSPIQKLIQSMKKIPTKKKAKKTSK